MSDHTDNNKHEKYEQLYEQLLGRGEALHESNKRRIRRGMTVLIILPFVLEFIRWLTDSDKVVFLIVWILIMFVLSAYLISIEYLDYSVESTLNEVTDAEASFDGLLPKPDLTRAEISELLRSRLAERKTGAIPAVTEPGAPEADKNTDIQEAGEADTDLQETGDKNTDIQDAKAAELDLQETTDTILELKEAEDAIEELRETAPAEIITAMKEAFDADLRRKEAAQEAPEDTLTFADRSGAGTTPGGEEDEA